ncbi:MAG: hypothetical protein HY760_00540 [Nitrospirae bacterium]|nr:hypothetical protein [Nitrospirota bacterium]
MDREQRIFQRGLISEKREKLSELEIKIDRCIKDIYHYLLIVDGIEELKIRQASQAMAELERSVREYKALAAELKEMEHGG